MHQSELRKLGWPKNIITDMGLENYELPKDPNEFAWLLQSVVTSREYAAIGWHYGLFDTYDTIGGLLNVSKERVRQIIRKGIYRFKQHVFAQRRHEREAAEKAEREAKIAAITDIRDMEFKDWFDLVYPSPDKLEIRIKNGIWRGFGYDVWEANGYPRNASREPIWPIITVGDVIDMIKTEEIHKVRNIGAKSVNRLIEMLFEAGITKDEMGLKGDQK